MAVGDVLGRAYIEVHADTAPFSRELPNDIDRATRSVKPEARRAGSKMGQEFVRGARDKIKKDGPGLISEIRNIFKTEGRRGNFAEAYGRVIGMSILAGLRRTLIGRIGRDFQRIFRSEAASSRNPILGSARMIGGGLISVFRNTFQTIGGMFSSMLGGGGGAGGGRGGRAGGILGAIQSLGSSIGNVGASGPMATVVGIGLIVGIPAIIGLILSLVAELGALINVVGYLPGAFAVAAAAIIPLTIGFQGFGEALGAVMENDPEKLNEALKKLTPSARAVVLELKQLMPIFTEIRKAVQERLFSKLTGNQFTATTKVLGPTISNGAGQVAESWGRFISEFMALLREPATNEFFKNLFSSTATVLDRLGPGFLDTMRGLMAIADRTLPRIEGIATVWGSLLSKFGDWLIEQSENGNLDAFLDKFGEALKDLLKLAGSGYEFMKTLLAGVDEGGAQSMFDSLVEMINALTDFFESEIGQKGLEGMVSLAIALVWAIGAVVAAWTLVVATIQLAIDGARELLELLGLIEEPHKRFTWIAGPNVRTKTNSSMQGHADGTITSGPEVALIGEAGPEAVIPLTDPGRARQLMAQSGLDTLAGGGDTNVYVYLGNEQLEPYMVQVQRKGAKQMARDLRAGPRALGVAG